jgi:DoxX-like protein
LHIDHSSVSSKRRITGKVLMSLGSILLVGSSIAKFAHVSKVVTELAAMGFDGDRLIAIAILEMLTALLFLVESTRSIGLLLASAYMGGAIATHVGHGSSPIQPAFVLFVLWLGVYSCHPQILWNFGTSLRGQAAAPAVVRGS